MNQPEWQTEHQQCMVSKENSDKEMNLEKA